MTRSLDAGGIPASHATARAMGRHMTLHVGPTNSGKTHEALTIAARAANARVLSPLRLLALEHYERLRELGLPAAMITGEEVLGEHGATHIAQTIETLDDEERIEVAVIDEVQMLADPRRGWAWTHAILATPASHVVMTGSADAVEPVRRLCALAGEDLEVVEMARKGELVALRDPVGVADLVAGDAVVAFSRKRLFDLKAMVEARGLACALVYGALPAEVRRQEAERFREGEADVLIATDAIGMGLNVGPLRRVLFDSTAKHDGAMRRDLTAAELRQIGGRAGRYGTEERRGWVGVLAEGDAKASLVRAIPTSVPAPLALPRFRIRPTRAMVEEAGRLDPGADLHHLLTMMKHDASPDAAFEHGDIEDMRNAARLVGDLDMELRRSYDYACAPFDPSSPREAAAVHTWAAAHCEDRLAEPVPVGGGRLEHLETSARICAAYLWFSRRYPRTYPRQAEIERRRRALNDEIADALAVRKGSRAYA